MCAENRTIDAKTHQPKMLVSIASATVAFALSKGMTMQQVESAAGISGFDLVNPDGRISDNVMPDLWRTMSSKFPDSSLPIQMARSAPFSVFGGLAHGSQFAKDLRSAINLLVRNRMVLADNLHMELVETEDAAEVTISHPNDGMDFGCSNEFGTALFHRLIKETLEIDNAVRHVDFSHAARGGIDDYLEHFGVPVRFEQSVTRLILHKECLDLPISHASAELYKYVTLHYDQTLRRLERQTLPSELLRLHRAVSENVSMGEFSGQLAAARANMSLRSAQRLAFKHGTSLQELIDQSRLESAQHLLADANLDIHTIASVLGYSDDRSFRRAFKRWTNQSPAKYRKSLTGS